MKWNRPLVAVDVTVKTQVSSPPVEKKREKEEKETPAPYVRKTGIRWNGPSLVSTETVGVFKPTSPPPVLAPSLPLSRKTGIAWNNPLFPTETVGVFRTSFIDPPPGLPLVPRDEKEDEKTPTFSLLSAGPLSLPEPENEIPPNEFSKTTIQTVEENPDDTLHPAFDVVKDKVELSGWLMRTYFNPLKHSQERYFSSEVTRENVLEFVSDGRNHFVQTPYSIANVWNLMPSLRASLRAVSCLDDIEQKPEGFYLVGETTLKVIGADLSVTPMSVKKISDKAVTKISALLLALNSDNKWLAEEADSRIENARLTVAEAFADGVQNSFLPGEVLEYVSNQGLLSLEDALSADEIELGSLQDLVDLAREDGASQADLEDIFLKDMDKAHNLFQTAQLCVANIVFPVRKGRPLKEESS